MSAYNYLICREAKKYLCLGKKTGDSLFGFQGVFDESRGEWLCDNRFERVVMAFIFSNEDCNFFFASEDKIPELDEYHEESAARLLQSYQ